MRNWFVVKNRQMRNHLLFYANFPGDFMRNYDIVYGLLKVEVGKSGSYVNLWMKYLRLYPYRYLQSLKFSNLPTYSDCIQYSR